MMNKGVMAILPKLPTLRPCPQDLSMEVYGEMEPLKKWLS